MKSNKKSTGGQQTRERQKYRDNDEYRQRTSLMRRSREGKATARTFCPINRKEIGIQIETKNIGSRGKNL